MTSEQRAAFADVVWVDPQRMHGTACFRDSRVPVQNLLDYLEEGSTIDSFLEDFPTVSRAQAVRYLELTKEVILECVSS